MTIGENIKKYRKIRRLTQKQLADKVCISVNSLSRYETGERIPNIYIIHKIANALDVVPAWIIGKSVLKGANEEELQQLEETKYFLMIPKKYSNIITNLIHLEKMRLLSEWKSLQKYQNTQSQTKKINSTIIAH